jgi:hypothetical protein
MQCIGLANITIFNIDPVYLPVKNQYLYWCLWASQGYIFVVIIILEPMAHLKEREMNARAKFLLKQLQTTSNRLIEEMEENLILFKPIIPEMQPQKTNKKLNLIKTKNK